MHDVLAGWRDVGSDIGSLRLKQLDARAARSRLFTELSHCSVKRRRMMTHVMDDRLRCAPLAAGGAPFMHAIETGINADLLKLQIKHYDTDYALQSFDAET